MERYEPSDWYDDGRPRRYRDMQTGEDISLHEYRKRRKADAAIDEGAPEPQDEQWETQAYAEPAPRPRLFDVSRPPDERPSNNGRIRRMGLAEMLTPAVVGMGESIARIRLRESPRQVFIPPKEVTTPIVAPIGRIIDRHLPAELMFLAGEDGKDVQECLTGLGQAMVWFRDAVAEYEGMRAYEQQQYYEQQRQYRNGPVRDTTPTPPDTTGNWAADIFHRVRNGGGSGVDDDAAARAADAPRVGEYSPEEAASRIHDLLRLDAEGVMRRGLADQS